MLEAGQTHQSSTQITPQRGCLAWFVLLQSLFLSLSALLDFLGMAEPLNDFVLLALFAAIPIGAFQFILGLVQYVQSRRMLLGFYVYFSAGYLAIFWLGPYLIPSFGYFGLLTVMLPLAMSWLLTYIQFYVPVARERNVDERYDDILDA
ncbi:MAG: hypothetical protein AAFP08_00520 [Bacteroidota bacterium]